MPAVILNGADGDSPAVDRLCAEVERRLAGRWGWRSQVQAHGPRPKDLRAR